nr:hypothetical protein [Kofleriaceae bacterium]
MGRALPLCALVVGCYSPHADIGQPCSPSLACPSDQRCDTTQSPPTCVALGAGSAIDDAAAAIDSPLVQLDATVGFGPGSLIIPMGSGFQDHGQLRAFGLVAALLRGGVAVDWIVRPDKAAGSADLELGSDVAISDVESGNALAAPIDYTAGPFVIDASERAAALPIVTAWLAGDTVTSVHDVTTGTVVAPIARHLSRAPAVAVFGDANDSVAFGYLNAAGIPDSTGAAWGSASPDVLTEAAVGSGALTGSPYCAFVSMHYGPATSVTPAVAGQLQAWLADASHGAVLECLSTATLENAGHFVTTAGVTADSGSAAAPVSFATVADPHLQIDNTFTPSTGAVGALTLPAGSQLLPDARVLVTSATGSIVVATGLSGRLTFLGGHQYSTALPLSTNPATVGTRLFLDSLFASGCP